ncbi:MAG: sigma-70 family RNA polymerase sigma factor [Planctomycetota bacterium]|nr:MAG: sigma-70 family RNA polymerase sigma factor [Planctomycetota bacterium]
MGIWTVAASEHQHLLDAALQGDEEAFGLLLDQYRPYLLVIARRSLDPRLRQRLDPADLVQTTFLEAQRDFRAFRGQSIAQLLGWLRNILRHNVSTAHQRHLFTEKRSAGREVTNRSSDSQPGHVDRALAETTSPSQRVIRGEFVDMLLVQLAELPDTQAEALRLRYLESLTLKEIAEAMGKSEVAVAGLLKRGLQTLRNRMISDSSSGWHPR